MYIIEAEFFDECNELFLGPYFMQKFLLLWRQGFLWPRVLNRTLGAVLRTFLLFFLRYKKIKRKQILINPPTSVVHANHHMQILPNFLQEAFEGDFNFIDPFGGDSPWHHGRHDILNFFVSV